MAKYFHIMTGLRGCYMPDSSYVIKADTRRELRQALAYEADATADSGYYLNRRAVATIAAAAWREAHKPHPSIFDFVIPYGDSRTGARPFGIFASVATRADYLEHESNPD